MTTTTAASVKTLLISIQILHKNKKEHRNTRLHTSCTVFTFVPLFFRNFAWNTNEDKKKSVEYDELVFFLTQYQVYQQQQPQKQFTQRK